MVFPERSEVADICVPELVACTSSLEGFSGVVATDYQLEISHLSDPTDKHVNRSTNPIGFYFVFIFTFAPFFKNKE